MCDKQKTLEDAFWLLTSLPDDFFNFDREDASPQARKQLYDCKKNEYLAGWGQNCLDIVDCVRATRK